MIRYIFFFLASLIILSFSPSVSAEISGPRYATCDACGFCINSRDPAAWTAIPTPASWPACKQCLYPNASDIATSGETLIINTETNTAPTPAKGRIYTVFQCVKTDLTDFTQTGAAGSFVQVLLNIIFTTSGGIALLYIIYGAFLIITSQGDIERLSYGKRVITGAIVGLILSLSTIFIVNLLASGVLRLPGFSSTPSSN